MDIELGEDLLMVKQMAKQFAETEVAPNAGAWDEKNEFPVSAVRKAAELGLLGMAIPENYGGSGMSLLAITLVIEEVARHCGGMALILASHNGLCLNHIFTFGSEEQKKKYVPDLASGRKLGAWALTEPGSGSDAAGLKTEAVLKGDHWVLNGTKAFITQGTVADTYVILARTDRSKGNKGISAFIVEKGAPGLKPAKKENKLGCRASDTSQIALEDVRIPKANLLGELNHGFIDTLKILDKGRVVIGAMALGLGRGALEESVKYANQRETFGKPIAEYQAIQWKIAKMATEIDAARLMIHKAATMFDKGEKITTEAAMAKLFASEAAVKACEEAVQIHGGYGYTKDYPVERYWRDSKLTTIGEGTSEVMRMVISRDTLA